MRSSHSLIANFLFFLPCASFLALTISSLTICDPNARNIKTEPLLTRDIEKSVRPRNSRPYNPECNIPVDEHYGSHATQPLDIKSELCSSDSDYSKGNNIQPRDARNHQTVVPRQQSSGNISDRFPSSETRIFPRVITEPKDVGKAQTNYRKNADILKRLRVRYEDHRRHKKSNLLRHVNQNRFIARLAAEIVRDEHNQLAEQQSLRKIADNNVDYLRFNEKHADADRLAKDADRYFEQWHLYYSLMKHVDAESKANHPRSLNLHGGLRRRSEHTGELSPFPPKAVKEAQKSYQRHAEQLRQMRKTNEFILKTLRSANPHHMAKNRKLSQTARQVVEDEKNQFDEQGKLRGIAEANAKALRMEGRFREASKLQKDAAQYFDEWSQNYAVLRLLHLQTSRTRKSGSQADLHRRMEEPILPRVLMDPKDVKLAVSKYRSEQQMHERMLKASQQVLDNKNELTKDDERKRKDLLELAAAVYKDQKNQRMDQVRLAGIAVNNVKWLTGHSWQKEASAVSHHSVKYLDALKNHYNFLIETNAAATKKKQEQNARARWKKHLEALEKTRKEEPEKIQQPSWNTKQAPQRRLERQRADSFNEKPGGSQRAPLFVKIDNSLVKSTPDRFHRIHLP